MKNLSSRGFTLIELMIVVVIIGVLASIAYPSYKRFVVDSRRADAQTALTQLAAQEEKFFTQCNKYIDVYNTSGSSIPACTGFGAYPTTSPDGYYTLAVTTTGTPATAFVATATPVTGTSQVGDGTLSISNTGLKQWDKNNDGSYGSGENTWRKN